MACAKYTVMVMHGRLSYRCGPKKRRRERRRERKRERERERERERIVI